MCWKWVMGTSHREDRRGVFGCTAAGGDHNLASAKAPPLESQPHATVLCMERSPPVGTTLGTCIWLISHRHYFRFKDTRFTKSKCLAQGHRAGACGAAGQPRSVFLPTRRLPLCCCGRPSGTNPVMSEQQRVGTCPCCVLPFISPATDG